jgi:AraC-like DNA-binding protein
VAYREVPPCEALRDRVACFWTHASRGGSHGVLPDGAMDIVVTLGGSDAAVVGTMTRAITVETRAETITVGVRFRPGAAIDLLGVSARELRDQSASLADVWRADGGAVADAIAASMSANDAIARLEACLVRRAWRSTAPDARVAYAVESLRRAGGELPVGAVAARIGVSERQLERLFDERVGIGPKMFARVVRLERALRMIDRRAGSWSQIAYACGFTDQAHLVREIRALSGMTPSALARSRGMSEIANPSAVAVATLRP